MVIRQSNRIACLSGRVCALWTVKRLLFLSFSISSGIIENKLLDLKSLTLISFVVLIENLFATGVLNF